jgi:Raf kinase inhibitor-like YbhB/YbcL family protein
MKRYAMLLGLVLALCLLAGGAYAAKGKGKAMKLSSPELKQGGMIKAEQVFNGFGCTGGNVSPALKWSGAPAGTKSFALTVYDPDAPTGSGWWHWVVFNIPAAASELPKNAGDTGANMAPAGSVQSRTDFGKPGWGGPCPPQGDKPHRYIFTIYALDLDHLDADADSSAALVGFYLHFHTLAKASIMAKFGR